VNEGIQLNQATLTLLTGISGVFSAVIVALFRLLLGRMDRAERQVDTLLPATTTMVDQVKGLRDEQGTLVELVRTLREDLSREQGRNR
jgi:uncharacterized protein YoxC